MRNAFAPQAEGTPPGSLFTSIRETDKLPAQEPKQREILFSGRVQGVGFRYTTRSLAADFEITGFVRNLPDGRVQLVIEGNDKEMDRFLVALHNEMDQYIFNQTETVRLASGKFTDFEIRF
jgi:acylphosphatase